ncbi:hypothetical protein [Alicyclobacillus macrosporangiidus]|uniref:hypothetical protein n=1 Tax=Alicyclobacillus macrosporangiidus TaxID=392015 RepID=UPI000496EFA5|nr:hypothetical protein [Alicyclobacillus macrosporangiidus]
MRGPLHRHRYGLVAVAAVAAFLLGHGWNWMNSATAQQERDIALPNDDFDAATMAQIYKNLNQYNVASTPQDHEVYVVTGGIGTANPRILEWDSAGNMDFGRRQGGEIFHILQMHQDPRTWQYAIPHVSGNTAADAKNATFTYTPTRWVPIKTHTGRVYYKLDDPHQSPQYCFQVGNTYFLVVPFPKDEFPEGLMTHLKPLGNPLRGSGASDSYSGS